MCLNAYIKNFYFYITLTFNSTRNLWYKKFSTSVPVSFVVFQWSLSERSFSCILQEYVWEFASDVSDILEKGFKISMDKKNIISYILKKNKKSL